MFILRKMDPQFRLIKIIGNSTDTCICMCLPKVILFNQHNAVKLLFSKGGIKLVILYAKST